MNRYTEALEVLAQVQDRANKLVASLRPPPSIKSNAVVPTEEDQDVKAKPSVLVVLKPYVKKHYIDWGVQVMLPEIQEDSSFIGERGVKHAVYAFLADYQMVDHEKELEQDRKGTLHSLHNDAMTLHDWTTTNVVLPEWELLFDEVGDPQLHKELDEGDKRLRRYTQVEKEMLSITEMIAKLKKSINAGHLQRKEIVDGIKEEKDTRSGRTPVDICHEQIHKLKPAEFNILDQNAQAIRIQLAMEDLDRVEMSYAGTQVEVERCNKEYKRLLSELGEKRKALENHKGLQLMREKNQNEELIRTTMKRDMEGYLNGFVKTYQSLDRFKMLVKNDRDKALNQLRIKSSNIEGTPTQAMADLVKVLEVTGFDQLGKLKPNVLKNASLSLTEEDVVARLTDSVAEIFKMKERFTTLATGVKNTTLFTEKTMMTDFAKGAGKLPKATGDAYLTELQKILTQHTKTLGTAMEDVVGSVRQRNRIVASSVDAEHSLLFGMWETEAIRYDLLHEYVYNDIKNSPSASALVPKGEDAGERTLSVPDLAMLQVKRSSTQRRKSSNKSQNKSEDEDEFFWSKLPKLVRSAIQSEESISSSASENGHSNRNANQEEVELPYIDRKGWIPSQSLLDDILATPPSPDMPRPHQVIPPIAPRGHW